MNELIQVTKDFRIVPGTHGEVGTSKQAKELEDQRRIRSNQMLSKKF